MKANLLQQLKQITKGEKDSLKESTLWKQAMPGSRVPAAGQVIHLYYLNSVGKGPQTTSDWDGQLPETAWVGVMGILKFKVSVTLAKTLVLQAAITKGF